MNTEQELLHVSLKDALYHINQSLKQADDLVKTVDTANGLLRAADCLARSMWCLGNLTEDVSYMGGETDSTYGALKSDIQMTNRELFSLGLKEKENA